MAALLCEAKQTGRLLMERGLARRSTAAMDGYGLGRKLLQDDSSLSDPKRQMCKPRRNWYNGKHVNWTPQNDKYIVATCLSGQATNRAYCFMRQILTAVLLNRTLIIPDEDLRQEIGGPYDYSIILDVPHIRDCLGQNTILTLKEFFQEHPEEGPQLKVDRLSCWLPDCNFHGSVHTNDDKWPVDFDEQKLTTLKLPPRDPPPAPPQHMTVQQTLDRYGAMPDRMLCLGDILGTGWTDGGPSIEVLSAHLPDKCQLLIKPHNAVVLTARNFVREFLGANYAALHLRRNDFQEFYYLSLHERGFFPLREVAECVSEKLQRLGIRLLFLVTDAAEVEVALFESFLTAIARAGKGTIVVRLPAMDSQWWQHDLRHAHLNSNQLARATLEKYIAALSTTFISTRHSSFSLHILELRRWLAIPDCEDGEVCAGHTWRDPVPPIVSRLINDSSVVPDSGSSSRR